MAIKKRESLSFKLSALVLLMGLFMGLITIAIGITQYYRQIMDYYSASGESLLSAAGEYINWNKIPVYLETGEEDKEYQDTLEELRLLNKSDGAMYMFVLVPYENGAYFIYDTDESSDQYRLGDFWEWYEDFVNFKDEIDAGEAIGPVVSDEEYGWLLSYYKPFSNSDGEFAGYLGVDYSVDYMIEQFLSYIFSLIMASMLASAVMTVMFYFILRRWVLRPVNKMVKATKNFVLEEESGALKGNSLSTLNINSRDEMESLANSLKSMETKIYKYISSLDTAYRRLDTDTFTELLNKEAFARFADQGLKNAKTETHTFMMIDIDNFKDVNDTYGHDVGDWVLLATAETIGSNFRLNDLVGRVGGDEFAVYCKNLHSVKEVERRIKSICEDVRQNLVKNTVRVTVSIGAVFLTETSDYQTIYKAADDLLYEVKKNGRDSYEIKKFDLQN